MQSKFCLCLNLLCLASLLQAQSWHPLGAGLNGPVYDIFIHENDVYVGGNFQNAGNDPDADYLARWDGCQWHAVAPGLNNSIYAIAVVGERIYVSGPFVDAGGNPEIDEIAFWDGVQWNPLGSGVDYYVSDMEVIGTDLYVGGGFTLAGDMPFCAISRWDGNQWHGLGSGPSFCAFDISFVSDIATDGANLYVAGWFTEMGGVAYANRIARWDGNQWHSLGDGIDPYSGNDILSITADGNLVFVAGLFTDAGGNTEADYLAVWDGNQWMGLAQSLPDSMGGIPWSPLIFQGALHCIYGSEILRWDDQTGHWTSVIDSLGGPISVASDAQNLYVAGSFIQIDGQVFSGITRWGEMADCTTSVAFENKNAAPLIINIHPNPSADILSYELAGSDREEISLTIIDVKGYTPLRMKTGAREIDVSSLFPGVYFIEIRDGSGNWRGKFVKL